MSTASGDRDRSGGMGMVPGESDIEEALRRALRSAADCVEPTGDGLTRIFRRLAAPWLVRQVSLLVTDCVDLLQLIAIWLQPAFAWATSVLTAMRGSLHGACRRLTSRAAAMAGIAAPVLSGWRRSEPDRPPALGPRARLRAAVARLRPALAVAGATAVVMMGSVAISQAVARIDLSGHPGATALARPAPTAGGHERSRASEVSGRSLPPPASTWPGTAAGSGGATHQRSCALKRCPPGPAGALVPGPASTPPAQPSTSPSPSPSPTPTPTGSHHGPHQPHQSHPSHPSHPGATEAPGH